MQEDPNKPSEISIELQILNETREQNEKLAKLIEGFGFDTKIERIGGVPGYPTTSAVQAPFRPSTRPGALGAGIDLFNAAVDYAVPSAELARTKFSLGRTSRAAQRAIVAGGALREAAGARQYVGDQYAKSPTGKDLWFFNPVTGQIQMRNERGQFETNENLRGIQEIARQNNISDEQLGDMLSGKQSISPLRDLVMQQGTNEQIAEMQKMDIQGDRYSRAMAAGGEYMTRIAQGADLTYRALRTATRGLDKLYAPTSAAAAAGYGMATQGGYPFPINQGAIEMVGRGIMGKAEALRPGLTGAQVNQIQQTIYGMGYAQAGQEIPYRDILGAMSEITQRTGGALAPQAQGQVIEMALRAGGSTNSLDGLVKMLSRDLPAAANASRLSIGQMHTMLMNTVQQVQQSPFNIMTPLQNYQRTLSAFETGAQPGVAQLLAGQNQLLDITAARLTGQSLPALQYSPFAPAARSEALGNIIGRVMPNVRNEADLYRMQSTNPDQFARAMQMLQQYGVDQQTLFGYFNQNNRSITAAATLGGLAQFNVLQPGRVVTGHTSEILSKATFGLFGDRAIADVIGDKRVVGERVIGPGGYEGDPNAKGSARELYEKNKKYIDLALSEMSPDDRSAFNKKLTHILETGGTATDIQNLAKNTQSQISKREAGQQTTGRNVNITIGLDPNSQAQKYLNIHYQNQAYKNMTINGNNGSTQPGSIASAQIGSGDYGP